MVAPSHQPLLSPPSKNPSSRRCTALLFLLAVVAVFFVAFFTVDHLPARPDLCASSPSAAACRTIVADAALSLAVTRPSPVQILNAIVHISQRQLAVASSAFAGAGSTANGEGEQAALADCAELLDLSRARLAAVPGAGADDARTWLSAVLTNHVTCLDELRRWPSAATSAAITAHFDRLISLASASLAVVDSIISTRSAGTATTNLITAVTGGSTFPRWVPENDRKLLLEGAASVSGGVNADAVVAKDGSGKYTTVQDAVNAAPSGGKRYVIYVKRGVYKEQVTVKKKDVMIVGDGMGATVITGSLNVVDGATTFNSATLAGTGDGLILQDLTIENTAGPEKHQAVALRVGADRAVINRCRIDGFQDTLYAHSLRQFFRDCNISGTVDFIFGNAAVVLQNSALIARLGLAGQQNAVTAQGRTDPNQNTGTSVQGCRVVPGADLAPVTNSTSTYLGRPWKQYSRTVYMESFLDRHIQPEGWLKWSGDFALDTLYYGEYMNVGPGAGTALRVTWPGYHVITDEAVAMQFTVAGLIQGGSWLTDSGVAFTEGL